MPPYSALFYGLFFALFALFLWHIARDEYARRIPLIGLGVLLVLFSGLRDSVGRDYTIYERAFNRAYSIDLEHMESIWQGFYSLLHFLHLDFPAWTLIVGALFVFLSFKAFRQQSYNIALSLLVFVVVYKLYFESFNIVRQTMAQAICLFSIPFMQRREYWQALWVLLFASLFHVTALSMLLLVPLMFVRYNRLFMLFSLLISLLVLPSLLEQLLKIIVPIYFKNVYYLENIWATQEGQGTGIGYWINTTFALYLLWRQKELLQQDGTLLPYFNSFFFAVIISNSFTFFQVADRFMFFPYAFLPILLANLFVKGRHIDRQIISLLLIYHIFLTVKIIFMPKETFIDYKIILKDKDAPSDFYIEPYPMKKQFPTSNEVRNE